MVLTDREIFSAWTSGQITIAPEPIWKEALSSTSLDLRLKSTIRTWKGMPIGARLQICPGSQGYSYNTLAKALTDTFEMRPTGFLLDPGQFVLAWTEEEISLPTSSHLAARVEGKSSLARLGIGVHLTAPTIHAGFVGEVQLEIYNHGNLPVLLETGIRVCQLIFEQTTGTPEAGYSGQFQHQNTTT